jgi:hypothetical protein
VIPDGETLERTYKLFAESDRLSEAFDEVKEKLEEESEEASITAPANLAAKVRSKLRKQPDITWHHAVRLIVDPDAKVDDDVSDEGD